MLTSVRRVKKGPGRRALSAERRRFMELRERGWGVARAARKVGVSRTSGNNWARGYKTYRAGAAIGFVPALGRLAVREISSRFLSQDERIEIADLRHAGMPIRGIAERLGRESVAGATEKRERQTGYRPFDSHRRAVARRGRAPKGRLETNAVLRAVVAELLAQR